jgi:hypothetical protein
MRKSSAKRGNIKVDQADAQACSFTQFIAVQRKVTRGGSFAFELMPEEVDRSCVGSMQDGPNFRVAPGAILAYLVVVRKDSDVPNV